MHEPPAPRRSKPLTLLLACWLIGLVGDAAPVPTLHVSDLFRPHNDPDDHWDLATQYALAWQGKLDLRGVMIDHPQPQSGRANSPDVLAVAQMNHITGKAVPVVVGSPLVPTPEQWQTAATGPEMAGIRAFLNLMRDAPRPVVIHVVGSCRDVALAMRLDPELFKRQCAAIYLNAGSGTPDPEQAQQLEWNVNLDPASYAAMFDAPCPVYWLPCFEVVRKKHRELFREAEYGSFYRFRQDAILPMLSERVQQYFLSMFAAGTASATSAASDRLWLQQLTGPKDADALAAQGRHDRQMWCTAGFLHATGMTVTKAGEVVPLASAPEPVFVFDPIRVKCSAAGVTEWSKDPASKNRFILRVTDVGRYATAMGAALKSQLTTLP
jgi:hypothetical protein